MSPRLAPGYHRSQTFGHHRIMFRGLRVKRLSLELVFGRDDPARVRFAVSPLWETMSALRVLLEPHRHGFHLPWLDAVRPGLDDVELWPLLALSPLRGRTPALLR